MNDNKYYAIKNKYLANGIQWLTGQRYYIFDDFENNNGKVYSFERTEKFFKALEEMNKLKNNILYI